MVARGKDEEASWAWRQTETVKGLSVAPITDNFSRTDQGPRRIVAQAAYWKRLSDLPLRAICSNHRAELGRIGQWGQSCLQTITVELPAVRWLQYRIVERQDTSRASVNQMLRKEMRVEPQ